MRRLGVGGDRAVEFSDFGFDNFRNCMDFEVIGDILRGVEDGTKDFRLATLDELGVRWLG